MRDPMEVDGPCGCGRSFTGLFCLKSTTTAEVAEWPIADEGYLELVYGSIHRSRMAELLGERKMMDDGAEWAERVLDFCRDLEPGTVVELRHEGMMVRSADPTGEERSG